MQRSLAAPDASLRSNGPVELVLDLQQRRRELAVVAGGIAQTDRLVLGVRLRKRALQRARVMREVVVADGERKLRIALVAERAHAQRRRVRQVQRIVRQWLQPMLAPGDERAAHG